MPARLRLHHVMIWGALIGGATVLLFELSYWTGAYLTWWGGVVAKGLTSLGSVVATFVALNYIRHAEGAQLSLPRGLVYGILIGAVVGLVVGAHDAAFFRYVDPAYTTRLLDGEAVRQQAHRQRLEGIKPRPDYLIEQTNKALAAIADKRAEAQVVEAHLGRTLLRSVATAVFFHALTAVVMGFILRNIPLAAPSGPSADATASAGT